MATDHDGSTSWSTATVIDHFNAAKREPAHEVFQTGIDLAIPTHVDTIEVATLATKQALCDLQRALEDSKSNYIGEANDGA